METYTVKLDQPKPRLKFRLAELLLCSAAFFILDFTWTVLSPSSSERSREPFGVALETGVTALLWGTLMVFVTKTFRPAYKLLVDDASITAISEYGRWMKWPVMRRTVRRGEVRTIFEIRGRFGRPGGIGISERSRFSARMWGFVYLPRTLEGYEELKRLVESWKRPDGQ